MDRELLEVYVCIAEIEIGDFPSNLLESLVENHEQSNTNLSFDGMIELVWAKQDSI